MPARHAETIYQLTPAPEWLQLLLNQIADYYQHLNLSAKLFRKKKAMEAGIVCQYSLCSMAVFVPYYATTNRLNGKIFNATRVTER